MDKKLEELKEKYIHKLILLNDRIWWVEDVTNYREDEHTIHTFSPYEGHVSFGIEYWGPIIILEESLDKESYDIISKGFAVNFNAMRNGMRDTFKKFCKSRNEDLDE